MVRPDISQQRDLNTRMRALDRKIEAVANARRSENTAIGRNGLRLYDTGGLTVDDGGEIYMRGGGAFRGDDGGELRLMHQGNTIECVQAGTVVSPTGTGYGLAVYSDTGQNVLTAGQNESERFIAVGDPQEPADRFTSSTNEVTIATFGEVGEISLQSGGGVVSMPGLVTSATAGVPVHINAASGRIYQFTSSARFKQDIDDAADLTGGVLALRPRRFRNRDDVAAEPDSPPVVGFIAEEVAEVLPVAVVSGDDGPVGLRETAIVTGLVQLAQQQQARIDAQQQQIDDLMRRVAALEGK